MKTRQEEISPHQRELLRAAAAAGPGHLGRRQDMDEETGGQLAKALAEGGLRPPPYLGKPRKWTERRAKLFEAGDYPDKGVRVTREQLVGLAERFDLPVPILIEHAKSPLELGYLTKVEADGDDLVGTVSLTAEADALIRESGAQSLSLGLSPGLDEIREVSLVRRPRVPSARLFGGEPVFTAPFQEETGWEDKYRSLRQEQARDKAMRKVADYLQAGRLVPAQTAFAETLLCEQQDVVFDGDTVPLARLVERLIESGVPHGLFRETRGPRPPAEPSLDPEARAFYERHFPGLDLGEIARNRRA